MSTNAPSRWRSVGAVAAGFALCLVLTLLIDGLLHLVEYFPPMGQPLTDAQCAVATVYRTLLGALGAALTARLAPSRAVAHAVVLGGIGAAVSVLGAVATWNAGLGPHWYPVALVVLAVPQCWLGGVVGARSRPS